MKVAVGLRRVAAGKRTSGRRAAQIAVSADLLLGTAISTYNLTMLKDIEKRIQMLPASEQQKLLDIFDAVISVELNHNQSERPNK